jgi:hypothetical protein
VRQALFVIIAGSPFSFPELTQNMVQGTCGMLSDGSPNVKTRIPIPKIANDIAKFLDSDNIFACFGMFIRRL